MPLRIFVVATLVAAFTAVLALSPPLTPLQAASDTGDSPLLGKAAPPLSGRALLSTGLINLNKMRTEVTFLRDEKGELLKGDDGRFKTDRVKFAHVLSFFATYCVPCIKEIPTFNKIAESYKDRDVKFFYVNVDVERSREEVSEFARKKGIAVEMMFPSVKYAMKAYDIDALPRIIVIDGDGVVRHVIRGFQDDLSVQMAEVLTDVLPKKAG